MKIPFTNTRLSARWLIAASLLIFTLFSHLAISQGNVTYTTETLPGGGALKGPTNHLMYVLKVLGGDLSTASFNKFSIKTTGTYAGSDIEQFRIYQNTSPSLEGATSIGSVDFPTGGGETLNFLVPLQNIPKNETRYYLITAVIDSRADIGKTFGINGTSNALNISYINNPTITNNQTNAAGLRTITGPSVTYTTQPLAAANVGIGTSNHVLYILKIVTGSVATVAFSKLSVNTIGTYTSSDIQRFVLYRNSTPTMTNAQLVSVDISVTGPGETLSFASLTEGIASNSTVYYLVTADVSAGATKDRTFGIDGSGNNLDIFYYNLTPQVVNNQTNAAGLQKISIPTVTYYTETLPAGNANQNTADNLLYILKIETGPGDVTFNNFNVLTSGNYIGSDIDEFTLRINGSPNVQGSSIFGKDFSAEGHGETLSFSGSQTLRANTITYFLVTADLAIDAKPGNTFGINGASNALAINYSIAPGITDHQENISGLQTITGPLIVCSTIPLGAANALVGTFNHVLYIFRISTGSSAAISINNISLRTTGTYTASDLSSFTLLRSSVATMTPQSIESLTTGSTVTGNGEMVSFSGSNIIQPNTTAFFGVVADVSVNATFGRTFGVDGANNDITMSFTTGTPTPGILDNQTNVAGLQTVFANPVTYSTVPIPAQNVVQGTENHAVYILKVTTGGAVASANTLKIKTTGNYSASDITYFKLYRSSSANVSPSTMEQASPPVPATGNGETLTFSLPGGVNSNSTQYYGIVATISPNATSGHTIRIDGSNNALDINFSDGPRPLDKINNQTNVADLQTIGVSSITYTTEPSPAGNVAPGAVDHPFYTFKVALKGDAGAILTSLEVQSSGSYQAGDITSFNLYQSDTPDMNNGEQNGRTLSVPIATFNNPKGAGELLTFRTGAIFLPGSKNTYLIITANVASSAVLKRTFYINGNTTFYLSYNGSPPSPEIDHQSDIAGEQTIESSLPVTLVSFDAKAEGSVRQLSWETSMETDNDYFEIQRSTDAKRFSATGQVKGTSAGVQTSHYSYTDSEAITAAGVLYYRLKMVDLDGSFAYSRIKSVQVAQSFNVTIFPNPVSEHFTVQTEDWGNVKTVKILNLTGTAVYNSGITGLRKTIDVKLMGEGIYVVELLLKDGQTKTSRIVITR